MIFSDGDFIVLGIVLLVLFLFRRLDKNSKSLEKVRRYAEKVKGELDRIFQEKEQQMKDLSINFEVQEQTYREILKRIQAAREELQGREESLSDLMARLEGFDERINGLYQLTGKVDENMIRLREESEYVDSLGLKLKDTKKAVEALDHHMKSVHGNFEKKNLEQLEGMKLSLLDDLQARMDIISGELSQGAQEMDRFHNELKDYRQASESLSSRTLDHLRQQTSEMQQEYEAHLKEAAERGLRLEDDIFHKLEEHIEDKRQALEDNWFRGMAELKEEVASRVEEIKLFVQEGENTLVDLRENQTRELGESRQQVENLAGELSRVEEQMERVSDSVQEVRQDALDSLQGSMNELGGRIQQELEAKKRDLEEELLDIRGARDDMGETLEAMSSQLKELSESTDALRSESARKLDEEIEELRSRLDGIRQESMQSLHDGIQSLKQEMEETQRTAIESVNRNAEAFQEELSGLMSDRKDWVTQHLDEWTGSMTERLEQSVTTLDKNNLEAHQDLEERVQAYEKDLGNRFDRFQSLSEELEGYEQNMGNTLENLEARIEALKDSSLDSARKHFSSMEQALAQEMNRREEVLKGSLTDWESGFDEELSSLRERYGQQLKDVESQLLSSVNQELERYRGTLEERYQSLTEKADQYSRQVEEALSSGDERIEAHREEMEERVMQLKKHTENLGRSLENSLGELVGLKDSYADQLQEFTKGLDHSMETMRNQMAGQVDETSRRLAELSAEFEQESMKGIELRQKEYEQTINGRFERLDSLTDDLDQLESSLRLSLGEQEERILGEMDSFRQNMQEQQEQDKESSNQRLGDIRRIISQVEGELNQLKTQAYENVSEKLQLFEDDFFSDLKAREVAMREGFEQWQKTIDLQLEEINNQSAREREELERNYQTQFKRKFNEIQSKVVDQLDKFQEQVQNFQNTTLSQIEGSEQDFMEYRQGVKEGLQKLRDESLQSFEQEFHEHRQSIEDMLARSDREVGQKLETLNADIEGSRNELSALITSSRSDISQWQNRVLLQLKNQQSDIDTELGDFRSQVVNTIEELREDFQSQKEDIILASSKDRAGIKVELKDLSDSVFQLKEDLALKTEQSLQQLEEQASHFMLEFQGRAREVQTESEERVKAIRQALLESRERMDQHQKQLQSQVEENYAVLSDNLEEIGRQQQEFIAQTHIFDQAESLKSALEKDMEELRNRMNTLERSRQELVPMEEEYARVLKAYQDVSSRMNQFFSEKQKIDLLDSKVVRINNLSEAIDLKVEQIDGTNDMLQEYMVRLRQLEDMHSDMVKRFQGLEKKASIVDATTSSVEKNLQILNHIEKGLKSIGGDLDPMKQDLTAIKESNHAMLQDKEKVDHLVATLAKLDETLADLEERQKRMDKAREWLASTETRMENIGREAQEKVKLLGALVQKEGKKGVRSTGSPDMNTREMVVQLARQGWNSEEIARQVKLSRGEVELILELAPPEE